MIDDLLSYCQRWRDDARQRAEAADGRFAAARLEARAEAFAEVFQQLQVSSDIRADGGGRQITRSRSNPEISTEYPVEFVRASELLLEATDWEVRGSIEAIEREE